MVWRILPREVRGFTVHTWNEMENKRLYVMIHFSKQTTKQYFSFFFPLQSVAIKLLPSYIVSTDESVAALAAHYILTSTLRRNQPKLYARVCLMWKVLYLLQSIESYWYVKSRSLDRQTVAVGTNWWRNCVSSRYKTVSNIHFQHSIFIQHLNTIM